jgi:hypothetical protein
VVGQRSNGVGNLTLLAQPLPKNRNLQSPPATAMPPTPNSLQTPPKTPHQTNPMQPNRPQQSPYPNRSPVASKHWPKRGDASPASSNANATMPSSTNYSSSTSRGRRTNEPNQQKRTYPIHAAGPSTPPTTEPNPTNPFRSCAEARTGATPSAPLRARWCDAALQVTSSMSASHNSPAVTGIQVTLRQ